MKISSLLAAAALVLSGCASPTWERVVASRTHYSGPTDASGKEGYISYLHQLLSNAGIEHKVVTYHFRFFNAAHEETVETATAVIYRDETTPKNPWWVMDEFHHVPFWLPSGSIETQLAFFIQRKVEVVEVKEYGAAAPARTSARPAAPRRIAQVPQEHRKLGSTSSPSKKPGKSRAAVAESDPQTTASLSAAGSDARSEALFRSTHGTAFDPGSSVDRAKMNALRRPLLNRNQSVSLRPE